MPAFCAILGCSNKKKKGHKGENKKYFCIPTVRTREGPATQELSERRRRLWIRAINRKGVDEKTVAQHIRVCSDHFISGKAAYLHHETDPDWVPSINMGCQLLKESDRKKRKLDLDAAGSLLNLSATASLDITSSSTPIETEQGDLSLTHAIGGAERERQTLTEVTGNEIEDLKQKVQMMSDIINDMTSELASLKTEVKGSIFDEQRLQNNDALVRSKKWVISTRRADLENKSVAALHRNNVVCEEHFEPSSFRNTKRKLLVKDAIPTLFAVPNPPPLNRDGIRQQNEACREQGKDIWASEIHSREGKPTPCCPDPVSASPYSTRQIPQCMTHTSCASLQYNGDRRPQRKSKMQKMREMEANMIANNIPGPGICETAGYSQEKVSDTAVPDPRPVAMVVNQSASFQSLGLAKMCLPATSSVPLTCAQEPQQKRPKVKKESSEVMPSLLPPVSNPSLDTFDHCPQPHELHPMPSTEVEEDVEDVSVKLEIADDEFDNNIGSDEIHPATQDSITPAANSQFSTHSWEYSETDQADDLDMSCDTHMVDDETTTDIKPELMSDMMKESLLIKVHQGILKFQNIIETLIETDPYLYLPAINDFLEAINENNILSDMCLQRSEGSRTFLERKHVAMKDQNLQTDDFLFNTTGPVLDSPISP